VEGVDPGEAPPPGEFPGTVETTDYPAWLMAVGAVMVGGVLWLLLRRSDRVENA
jgi:hypothetical protein